MVNVATVSAPDVLVHNHGSIILVEPRTPEARAWLLDNTSGEVMWYGNDLVVEPRYVDDLLTGMAGDGFVIQ